MERGGFIRQRISLVFQTKLNPQSNLPELLLLDVLADQNRFNSLKFQFFRMRFTGDQRRMSEIPIFKQNWTCSKPFIHLQTMMIASFLLPVVGPMNISILNSLLQKVWIVRGPFNARWSMVWLRLEMVATLFPIECVMEEKVASS